MWRPKTLSRYQTGPDLSAHPATIATARRSSPSRRRLSSTPSWLKRRPTALGPLWSPPWGGTGRSFCAPQWSGTTRASSASAVSKPPSALTCPANWLSSPLISPRTPHAARPTRAQPAAGWRPASAGAAPSAHQQTKPSVCGSTPRSFLSASLSAEHTSPPLLLRSNRDNKGHTGFTYIYLYGIAWNVYIRHTALGSLLTFNGWFLSRPGSSRAPPTQQPTRRLTSRPHCCLTSTARPLHSRGPIRLAATQTVLYRTGSLFDQPASSGRFDQRSRPPRSGRPTRPTPDAAGPDYRSGLLTPPCHVPSPRAGPRARHPAERPGRSTLTVTSPPLKRAHAPDT
jgi:hypothetical protein